MNWLDQLLPFDKIPPGALPLLADWGNSHLSTFLLIAARLAGFLWIVPSGAGSPIAWHLRIVLTLSIAAVLTPLVAARPSVSSEAVNAIRLASHVEDEPGMPAEVNAVPRLLSASWLKAAAAEVLLGVALGFGVLAVLASLQMAGELIDPQCGLQSNRVLNFSEFGDGSPTGRLLLLTGMLVFLVLPTGPNGSQGGMMLLVGSFLDTFDSLPAGSAIIDARLVDVLIAIVQHSLALTLLVAAPVLACATLLALLWAAIGRVVPESANYQFGVPLRICVCLLVLAFSLSGAATAVTREVPLVLKQISSLLAG